MFLNMDLEKSIVHHASKQKYRDPLGALKTGSYLTLRIFAYDASFENVNLTLLSGSSSFDHAMQFLDGAWTITITVPDYPCVLWYYFTLKTGDRRVYYGRNFNCSMCIGKIYWEKPPAFQITVYDRDFTVPLWFANSTMYQIFPDRFARGNTESITHGAAYHSALGRRVYLHKNWDEKPLYRPLEGEHDYSPCDYFGGDIRGIIERLPYLEKMGISVLYLNPIFEADSNHRYNTADYKKVDPFLGSAEDLAELFKTAKEMGIRILLDGVFSHTGADSIYFNKDARYPSPGAYQSEDSPYFKWYVFEKFPDEYKSWWGFQSLPEVNENDPGWINAIIEDENSVIKSWLKAGASGYRLDVADELPDNTIEKMRLAVKSTEEDNVLLGEVWEDATTKQSYGRNRTYALGRGLDSVMNYPFRNTVVDFLLFKKTAFELKDFLVGQSQNYPRPMYFSLMNLLSSHDIERVHTVLSTGVITNDLTREQQSHFIVLPEQSERGDKLQRIAAAIQFTIPGVPCIYYGDENSIDGLKDPFNRGTFNEQDTEICKYYINISNLRKSEPILRTGKYSFFAINDDIAGILRFVEDGKDIFDVSCQNGVYLTVINRAKHACMFAYDLHEQKECMPIRCTELLREMEYKRAVCQLSGLAFNVTGGIVNGEVPPLCSVILKFE